jgi:phosphoglycolate phosphatase
MKSSYKHIIFDLDGTLSDSREGIFNAYHHTFHALGMADHSNDELKALIGPPLQKGFLNHFGLSGKANDNAVKVFREYYSAKGLYENTLYDGMRELLAVLALAHASLYVATSKYFVFASKVIDFFGLSSYFKEISGADYDGRITKVDLIAGLLRRNGIHDPADVVIIGDTRYDIDAATELEIDSIGVTYGFSTAEELTSYNPDYIAHTVSDLYRFLLNRN